MLYGISSSFSKPNNRYYVNIPKEPKIKSCTKICLENMIMPEKELRFSFD